ncbi:MAG TPA: ABC transporter ATP-binding protein [Candidatus Scybalocola faecigallinarum]|uniref:ABC transporter ATP-binding protein n=1 Tax=Candidatus Scybalocola faecigallinarum TaxID=2840941 RepID=A0A9D1F1X1_9FIRM|nr:ABC transporter ATP-binding protein [Candidatus Scybalocola faecigallinarum]
MDVLELKDVRYVYQTKYQKKEALKGISGIFETGKLYAVVGRSGSGKTTLLSLMAGLDLPTSGDVICEGVSTARMDLAKYRRENAAVIYQSFRLIPLLTVAENIMYPMELMGMKAKQARKQARELAQKVNLPEELLDRFPTMLSGGEQQRVAIARALGMNTKLLLADEPTGNLDTQNSSLIFELLQELAHEMDYCVIVVTHDMELASKADQIIELQDGRVVEDDPEGGNGRDNG